MAVAIASLMIPIISQSICDSLFGFCRDACFFDIAPWIVVVSPGAVVIVAVIVAFVVVMNTIPILILILIIISMPLVLILVSSSPVIHFNICPISVSLGIISSSISSNISISISIAV